MNLLTMHEVVQAENEVLKKQMKYQKFQDNETLAKKYVLEIVQLNKEVMKRKVKLKERK